MKTKLSKGVTPLEFVVTFAVVGLITYMTVFTLENARKDSRIGSIYASLGNVVPGALACLDSGVPLSNGDSASEGYMPIAGRPICEGSGIKWPELIADWTYNTGKEAYTTSDFTSINFSFNAKSDLDEKKIVCSKDKCQVSDL